MPDAAHENGRDLSVELGGAVPDGKRSYLVPLPEDLAFEGPYVLGIGLLSGSVDDGPVQPRLGNESGIRGLVQDIDGEEIGVPHLRFDHDRRLFE